MSHGIYNDAYRYAYVSCFWAFDFCAVDFEFAEAALNPARLRSLIITHQFYKLLFPRSSLALILFCLNSAVFPFLV